MTPSPRPALGTGVILASAYTPIYSVVAYAADPLVTAGDDWGFTAHPGYAQTNGLGVMDGEKLFEGLRSYDASVAATGSAAP